MVLDRNVATERAITVRKEIFRNIIYRHLIDDEN